jgi:hypothetical protein
MDAAEEKGPDAVVNVAGDKHRAGFHVAGLLFGAQDSDTLVSIYTHLLAEPSLVDKEDILASAKFVKNSNPSLWTTEVAKSFGALLRAGNTRAVNEAEQRAAPPQKRRALSPEVAAENGAALYAIAKGKGAADMTIVRALIAAGANLYNKYPNNEQHILTYTAYHGHTAMMRALLDEDSSAELVRLGDRSGLNALMNAACGGYVAIVEMLLEADPSPEHINAACHGNFGGNWIGKTALSLANEFHARGNAGCGEVAAVLKAAGAV